MHEIKIIRQVTDEQINDVMTTALEGGINYWCDKATTSSDLEDTYLSEILTKGSTISLHDAEEDKWYALTLHNLIKAMEKIGFNFDDYDSMDVDCVVQEAIFGEVIYG